MKKILGKKSLILLCLLLTLVFTLTACSKDAGKAPEAAKTDNKAAAGAADKWPEKTINIIMTHGAGGDTDYNGRLLARFLEKKLGKPVVVNNITGGNGSIAMTQGKSAKPDGYTFIMTNTAALTGNEASAIVDFGYDAFAPVAIYGRQSGETIVVKGDSPYTSLEKLIKASQDKPNTIKFGISTGGGVYAASVMLEKSGSKFAVVDAGDGSARMASLLGGHVDATIVPFATAKEYIAKGTIKPLCTLMSERLSTMPDMPTAREAGAKEVVINTLYAMLAPKGTDPAVVEKLNAAILDIVKNDAEYAKAYLDFNNQKAWALNVKDTVAELDAQRKHFMNYSQYLK